MHVFDTLYIFYSIWWCYNCLSLFNQSLLVMVHSIISSSFFYKFDNSFYDCSSHDYAHKICSFVVKQIAGVMGTDDVLLALQSFYVYTTRTHIFTYMQHYIWNYKSSMVITMAQQRSTQTIKIDGWKLKRIINFSNLQWKKW